MSRPLTHREACEAALLAYLAITPERCAFYATLPWSTPARLLFEFLEDEPSTVRAVGYVTTVGVTGLALLDDGLPELAAYIDRLTLADLLTAGSLEELARQLLAWDHPAALPHAA